MNFENDIEKCLDVLKRGGLIVYPTDTIWGIGCDATNAGAVQKIYSLKQRSDQKAMIVLVADEADILKHVAAPDLQIFDYLRNTKKPTTVIFDGAIGFADNLVAKDGSIAIRICRDSFCKHLIKRFRKPIVSTSANISGEAPPTIFSSIDQLILDGADHIVKYRQDDKVAAEPSAIIKWKDGGVEVLRP